MKTVGIIGAMEEEIEKIKEHMNVAIKKNTVGLDLYIGTLYGKNIVLVRSGIGKVNAAVCAQIIIDLYGADCVINSGAAGAVSEGLKVGDIVISEDSVHHDFDTTAFGDPPGFIPRSDLRFIKSDSELLKTALKAALEELPDLTVKSGRIASGDQFISSEAEKNRIKNIFKADCVEMEGAAIAQVCCLNGIPHIIIRSISDSSDGGAEESFEKFLETASYNSSRLVMALIKNM